jgi:nucleoside-diphosphate-sugar epimerase
VIVADKLVIGCGFLGRRVAALWRAQGHRVWATTRKPERAAEWRRLGLEPVLCDVCDAPSLRSLPPAETVVYCVGLDRTAGRPMRAVYVEGLANVLDELRARPAAQGRFLYVSSTSVYGQTGGEEVDETSPAEPVEESGRVVRKAERLLRERLPGAIVLRFAGIYGPGRLIRGEALRKGEPLGGDPEGWLNLVHVEDGAAAVLAAEERGQAGQTYIVSDDRPLRRREFYGRLAELLGAPPPRFEQAPGSSPPHPRANRRLTNRRLRHELGVALRYPSFQEGLSASL